jgi:hypothetical protein
METATMVTVKSNSASKMKETFSAVPFLNVAADSFQFVDALDVIHSSREH